MAEIKKVKQLKKTETKNPLAKLPIAKIGYIVFALAFSIVLFIGLLILQDYLNNDITYVDVIVAKKDIKQDEIITEANVEKYFSTVSINQLNDVSGSIKDASELINQKARIDLRMGEIVCDKDFKDLNPYIDDLENPVQVAISSSSLAAFNGGTIRAGDLVNISIVQSVATDTEETVKVNTIDSMDDADTENVTEENEKDTGKNEETKVTIEKKSVDYNWQMEYVYVSGVKDSSGITIPNTDTSTAASLIMIIIEKEDAIALDNALNNSSQLRLAKVLYE